MPDYGNGDNENLHVGGKNPRTEAHHNDEMHNTTPQRAQQDTMTSAKKVYETRKYQEGMKAPGKSVYETPTQKSERLQKEYPAADTSPYTGHKPKKF